MFRNVFVRLMLKSVDVHRSSRTVPLTQRLSAASVSARSFSDVKDELQPFDSSLLDFLVCPLSKKPLRYDPDTNELINEDLGIAYPIIDGIPNMIPQEARLIQKAVDESFPQGCTSTNSLCFYSLLLPVTIPLHVFFHLWSWMGIMLFRHN